MSTMKPPKRKSKTKKGPGEQLIENDYPVLSDEEIIELFSDYRIFMPDHILICRR